jgi:hypothetical protein
MQDFQMTARDWVVLGVVLALAAAVFVMGR